MIFIFEFIHLMNLVIHGAHFKHSLNAMPYFYEIPYYTAYVA
jgi:hypothetical protein